MENPINTNPEDRLDRNALILIFGALAILVGAIIFVMKDNNDQTSQGTLQASESAGLTNPQTQATSSPTPVQITELQKIDLVEGTGAEATSGAEVTVHYTGTFTDGKKFDSSIDRGQPFSFQLGAGQVIQGWDLGVAGMKVGGKRRLLIPSNLAYGEQGAPGAIPPNSPLVFEVELLGVK